MVGKSDKGTERATIRDVARESGVALSTVSNALSGKHYVSEETRQKVQETADRLGYRPSFVARALRMQRSFTLGVLTADISNPAFPDFVRGIEDVALRERCNLLLCNTDSVLETQLNQMRALLDRRVDGIVLISQHCEQPAVRELLNAGTPFVLLQRRTPDFADDYVGADNQSGIVSAVQHLVDLGHRRIGFVQGPGESSSALERRHAFVSAIEDFGLDPDPQLVFEGDYTTENGRVAGAHFFGLSKLPTAIMASNDINAIGIMDAAAAAGLRIPDDLSLVGFDNIALAGISRIDLTTIHLPKRDMGAAAGEVLMKRVRSKRPPSPRTVIMPTHLVVRSSTGPARPRKSGTRPGKPAP